jgi:hypothetical protein
MKLSRRSSLVLAAVLALGLVTYGGAKWVEARSAFEVPAGAQILVRLDHSLASDQNRSGDEFEATVSAPVVVEGKTVIPSGAPARGVLVDARESGRLKGVARLSLKLTEVQVGDDWYDLETYAVSRRGPNHKRNNWAWIGGGAATGALIGGIAGGGKGALIGGPVGAGAGVAMAAATGKKDVRFGAERQFVFTLSEPVKIQPAS